MHEQCCQCGAPLTQDEVGLTKKLINRGATSYLCYPCLAQRFAVTVEVLQEKVNEFREMGCTLFT
ncbi:MAG: hypothetical protein PUC00_00770 [Clostridiales bacterium]|nr:hypothetical protein [Clostridiales bacterium]